MALISSLAWLVEADLVEVASTGLLPDVLVDNLGTIVGHENWIDDDSDDNEDGGTLTRSFIILDLWTKFLETDGVRERLATGLESEEGVDITWL